MTRSIALLSRQQDQDTSALSTRERDLGKFDFLVGGGGAVGCAMALGLGTLGAQHGWRVGLIERRKFSLDALPPETGRAYWLSQASVHVLRRLGIWQHISSKACSVPEISLAGSWAGSPVVVRDSDRGGTPLGWMMPEGTLLSALLRGVLDHPAIDCFGECDTGGVSVEGGWASIPVSTDKSVSGTLRAPVIVACDGASSVLRTYAGIGIRRREYGQMNLVALVQLPNKHGGLCRQNMLDTGPLALLPLGEDQASLAWTVPAALGKKIADLSYAEQEAELNQRLSAVTGNTEKAESVKLITPLRGHNLSLTLARRAFASRIVLVGDSLRSVHPLLGQGLNWGLRDVAAFADEMLATAHVGGDLGGSDALRSYERKRQFDTLAISAVTDGMVRLFCGNPAIAKIAGLGLGSLARIGLVRKFLVLEADGALGITPSLAQP